MERKIFAVYDEETIRVYQAYGDRIANQAVRLGTFGSEFKMERMTWVKPSFLWMMYRSGWSMKDGQNRILAIDIKREGFDFIVRNAVRSSFSKEIYSDIENWKAMLASSEIRCQWDPERDIYGNPLEERTIQLGIRGSAVKKYVNEWIVKISDITDEVRIIKANIDSGGFSESMLPVEREYFIIEK